MPGRIDSIYAWHEAIRPLMVRDDERLRRTAAFLLGFFGGCVAGAAAVSLLGGWAWSLPAVLAGAAVALR